MSDKPSNIAQLEIKDLVINFKTDDGIVNAVKKISFSIPRGKTVGLVGESGSGKSVTSLATMRLIPSPPGSIDGGEILFNGKNLLDLSVGKAGDLNHWIDADINILVGIDICKDGLINNENGACNRILNKSIEHKKIAENYFIIWGDSSKNLTNGDGGKDDLHKYFGG